MLTALLFSAMGVWAQMKDMAPIGTHFPVFVVEKNENPQNIMVTYVKLDKECRFVPDPRDSKKPLFEFYWLMNREKYKPVHRLIKAGVRKRLEIVSQSADRRSFVIRLNDVKELNNAADAKLTVTANRESKDCDVSGILKVGDEPIELTSIYSHARKTMLPPFRKLNYITLKGTSLDGSDKIERKISAR
jgi:hypothetical protein